jgi:hypothetical protein
MTPEDRINQLCALIQTEANPQEFTRLVKELKDLLDSKLGPIQGEPPQARRTSIQRKVLDLDIRPLLYSNAATRPIKNVLMCSIDD